MNVRSNILGKMELGRIVDSLNALAFRRCPVTVHTSSGEMGGLVKTHVFAGTIEIRNTRGEVVTVRGRDVADLDSVVTTKYANRTVNLY